MTAKVLSAALIIAFIVVFFVTLPTSAQTPVQISQQMTQQVLTQAAIRNSAEALDHTQQQAAKPQPPAQPVIVVPVGTRVVYQGTNGRPNVQPTKPRFEQSSVTVHGERTEILQDNVTQTVCYKLAARHYEGDWSCVPLPSRR